MTLTDLLEADDPDLADPLALMASACYQWGNCQALRYDPTRTDIFPGPSFLVTLYERCQAAGGGKLGPLGTIPALFCNMRDVSCEAVVAYLQRVPIVVVGEWRKRYEHNRCVNCHAPIWEVPLDSGSTAWSHYGTPMDGCPAMLDIPETPRFYPLGFTFPTGDVMLASPALQSSNRNAAFCGYGFFGDSWRTPQQTVCMYLGLSFLFKEFRLAAIHGTRFADNHLTARWAGKFGFRDVGHLPTSMYRYTTGDLAAMTVSTLSRQTFSDLLRQILIDVRGSNPAEPEPGKG